MQHTISATDATFLHPTACTQSRWCAHLQDVPHAQQVSCDCFQWPAPSPLLHPYADVCSVNICSPQVLELHTTLLH